jgi:5-methylcytosine-specific restriction enzyme A
MAKKRKQVGSCELCDREEVEVTVHHLTPKEMGGTFMPTDELCIPCHKQIHALYTNEELADTLNTIQLLKMNPELNKFIKWIKKQPSTRLPRISKSNVRKRKKR